MTNTKISVIIPVYNCENYLEQCISSVLNQTLKDIEIIVINDGSTDNSGEVLKKFQDKICIINQKNLGQATARNIGIKKAKGKYIAFVDADDYIHEQMLEKLYKKAFNDKTDITVCSMSEIDKNNKSLLKNDYLSLNIFPKKLKQNRFSPEECYNFLFRICVSPWNKIYKRSFLIKNNLFFPEGLAFEDNVFFLKTFLSANKINLLDEELYFYRQNTSSTRFNNDAKKLDFFKIFDLMWTFLKKQPYKKTLKKYFEFHKKKTLIYWYFKINDEATKKIYYKKLIKLYPDFIFYQQIKTVKNILRKTQISKLIKQHKVVLWGNDTYTKNFLKENNLHIKTINPQNLDEIKELNPDLIIAVTNNFYNYKIIIENKLSERNIHIPVRVFD